jgi:hypothetical protein
MHHFNQTLRYSYSLALLKKGSSCAPFYAVLSISHWDISDRVPSWRGLDGERGPVYPKYLAVEYFYHRRRSPPHRNTALLKKWGEAKGGSVENTAQLEEWNVDHSGRIILKCKKCAQRLMLLGLEEDWVSEGRTEFECKCGKRLTLGRDRSLEEGHEHEADAGVGNLLPFLRNQRS